MIFILASIWLFFGCVSACFYSTACWLTLPPRNPQRGLMLLALILGPMMLVGMYVSDILVLPVKGSRHGG